MLELGMASRLTVLLRTDARWHHRPAYTEVVHRAHAAGLAGASVFHGIEGFGKSDTIHTTRLLDLADHLPCAVVIIDAEHRIRDFLPQLDELLDDGIAFINTVDVVTYVGRRVDQNR